MLNSLELYKKIVRLYGKSVIFSHQEFKECLERQREKCEICNKGFGAFGGAPVILGKAKSAVCLQCSDALQLLGFNKSNIAKAILVSKKIIAD